MYYTESHEWIHVEQGVGTVGITRHAQKELGEIVFVELPMIGKVLSAAQEAAVLESTKAASDVYSPASGTVIEVNERLKGGCSPINQSPESEGWLFKIRIANLTELETLMSSEEYLQLVE